MTERVIDWRAFLNALVYCHGCGRFGRPQRTPRGRRQPRNWLMLYQPHADTPPMLLACSTKCADDVRAAMKQGPVIEPLKTAADVMMPAEMREAMFAEIKAALEEEEKQDDAEEGSTDHAADSDRPR